MATRAAPNRPGWRHRTTNLAHAASDRRAVLAAEVGEGLVVRTGFSAATQSSRHSGSRVADSRPHPGRSGPYPPPADPGRLTWIARAGGVFTQPRPLAEADWWFMRFGCRRRSETLRCAPSEGTVWSSCKSAPACWSAGDISTCPGMIASWRLTNVLFPKTLGQGNLRGVCCPAPARHTGGPERFSELAAYWSGAASRRPRLRLVLAASQTCALTACLSCRRSMTQHAFNDSVEGQTRTSSELLFGRRTPKRCGQNIRGPRKAAYGPR